MSRQRPRAGLLVLVFAGVALFFRETRAPADDWPQWRGPDRSNVSAETGLLREWPKEGPPLLWKAEGLGEGVASVAVADGRVFTLGYRGEDEFVTATRVTDGKRLWSTRIGPAVPEARGMRWLSQRTPTVDGERLYAVTAAGVLACLETTTGKERWRKDYGKDFGGKKGRWGYCDYPLVDGDRLVCTPGGATAALVALHKMTGDVLWKVALPEDQSSACSVTVMADIQGTRQYIAFLERSAVGIAAASGRILWRDERFGRGLDNRSVPLLRDNLLCFVGEGRCGLLKISSTDDKFQVEELWSVRKSPAWLATPVLIGDHVYFCQANGMLLGLEFKTGEVRIEQDIRAGQCSLTCADGRLYLRDTNGKVRLILPSPQGLQARGEFEPTRPDTRESSGVLPVISDGQLYLRDMDWLLCYDIQDPAKRHRGPRPAYVPSPQDVVEKMLELAKVTRDDRLVDLGCGDGRIVVTAAKKYGCKALGYDLDKECVRLAQENVKKNDLEDRVHIERKDVLDVDLSQVSVVALYLVPALNRKLVPQFEKMKPGSRIISHGCGIPGYAPDQIVSFTSKEDDLQRKLYLFTTPLKKASGEE